MARKIRIHRLGRHRGDHVEASCGVLDILQGTTIEKRIVVDCGIVPFRSDDGKKETRMGPEMAFFSDGKRIDEVYATHAHWDHIGGLPLLTKWLAPDARVVLTGPTTAMAAHVFGQETRMTAGHGPPLYSQGQVNDILKRVFTVSQPGRWNLPSGLSADIQPVGHINGACSFMFRIDGTDVLYTGDRCAHDQPSIRGAVPFGGGGRPLIVAGSDCTYGASPDSDGRSWQSEMAAMAAFCSQALRDGRRVLIYSFGVHRGGAVAQALQDAGVTRLGPVYIDGSARDFALMMSRQDNMWCAQDVPLKLSQIRPIKDHAARLRASRNRCGYVVIATPGMGGPGGVGTWWRRDLIADPDAAILFTGFIAPGTDGQLILDAVKERDASGRAASVTFRETDVHGLPHSVHLPIRSEVRQFRLGSHDNRRNVIKWLRTLSPDVLVLSHGSPAALESVEAELADMRRTRFYRTDLEPMIELDL